MTKQVRALGLLSGGLDSILACRVLMEQGIHVEAVNYYTGFCVQTHTRALRNPEPGKEPARHDALKASEILGIELHIVDIAEEYVEIVTNPKYGYGKNLNPCLDCKIFMVEKAWQMAQEMGFDFIFTGEVVGQRPMSQRSDTMPKVAREGGATGWLLRPLCAHILPETEPEKQGLVDRERLFGFNGRTRKPQMALAAELGIEEYPSPAGGCCFLTDESYSRKLQDLWDHRQSKQYTMDDIMLLKVGRHIRPNDRFKIIIGRDQTENGFLRGMRQGRHAIRAVGIPGPLALVEGEPTDDDLALALRMVGRFGKGKNSDSLTMEIRSPTGALSEITTTPLPPQEIDDAWYV
ncbi:MAG: tRNA (5-methylaminomethyl-2-thiouridylate)-methyltransferase [Magnetococcales bacterium]|nr:tRNA (5-methylaminomethyl-2-thiouridylate)-methyltransferase [Magnetococcales bacterium]